jgi:hypothetical protein
MMDTIDDGSPKNAEPPRALLEHGSVAPVSVSYTLEEPYASDSQID